MSDDHRCMRCEGRLEEGFFLDHGHMDSRRIGDWVRGKPEPSFWTGVKADKADRSPVRALRCTTCGRLELFA